VADSRRARFETLLLAFALALCSVTAAIDVAAAFSATDDATCKSDDSLAVLLLRGALKAGRLKAFFEEFEVITGGGNVLK
jgi:hypothetical protein